MIDFGYITKQNLKEHYLIWPQITHHLSRILIIGSSRSGKTNALLNLIIHKLCTEEMYLLCKDSYERKYYFLVNKCKGADLKHRNDS